MSQTSPQTNATHGQSLPVGTQLEEFVIERVLGSGGFGITYLARDKRLGRQVVIKENLPAQFCWRDTHALTVRPRHMEGEDADNYQYSLDSFEREASTLASLDHPGIVKVLRSFEAYGTAYFVMPFVEGTALDEVIRQRTLQNNPFTEAEIQDRLAKVLDALSHLHDRGIYHRDIKPGNILMTKAGPVLIDFGAARQRLSERSLTVIESAGYTPFEQLQSHGKIGPWSDIYALGGTLYKAITGETPAKATDRAFDDPVVPLAKRVELCGRYSPALLTSIDKAMSPKASDRFQTSEAWKALMSGGPAQTRVEPMEDESVTIVIGPRRKTSQPPITSTPTDVPAPHPERPIKPVQPVGIGRGQYALLLFGAPMLIGLVPLIYEGISTVALMLIWTFGSIRRLQNIGKNPWWTVLVIIPLVNIAFMGLWLALPPMYQIHRKLDLAAKIIAGCMIGIPLLMLGILIALMTTQP